VITTPMTFRRRCSVGVIPSIYELLDGSVSIEQVRDVRIEDLLRRASVRTDVSAVSGMLRGKRVLVTGAACPFTVFRASSEQSLP